DVLYAVSEDYGWIYGWDVASAGGGIAVARADGVGVVSPGQPSVIVSSVSFAGGHIRAVGHLDFSGYSGVFNVTPFSILLAHDVTATDPRNPSPAKTDLLYPDTSDPAGAIDPRGSIVVDGRVQGWGADNGRWNLDFADGKTAHVIGCAGGLYGCSGDGGFVLSTADF